MQKFTLAEQILYSSVRILVRARDGTVGTGTGFFYQFEVDSGRACILLVTNKHVLNDAEEVSLLLHVGTDSPSGEVIECRMSAFPERVVRHASPAVDLCALPLASLLKNAKEAGKTLFFVNLTRANIPGVEDWENFDAIEEVTMVGCPRGLFDEVNNTPIVRRGITATSLARKYNGDSTFLVDMACFPGSSGSPIFVYDRMGYLDRSKNAYVMGSQRFFFVGVLFAGPEISNIGKIVMGQPPKVEVATMMHLGYAVRSTELFGLEEEVKRLASAAASKDVASVMAS